MEGLLNAFDPKLSATPSGVFDVQKEVKYIQFPLNVYQISVIQLARCVLNDVVSWIIFSLQKLGSLGSLLLKWLFPPCLGI